MKIFKKIIKGVRTHAQNKNFIKIMMNKNNSSNIKMGNKSSTKTFKMLIMNNTKRTRTLIIFNLEEWIN